MCVRACTCGRVRWYYYWYIASRTGDSHVGCLRKDGGNYNVSTLISGVESCHGDAWAQAGNAQTISL